ncbi:hypothetical protein AGMMS49992_15430 [Clostridia bacterium]|nr:hypothetical protein AGMMS49992_15430 [Clostridia bacterium]
MPSVVNDGKFKSLWDALEAEATGGSVTVMNLPVTDWDGYEVIDSANIWQPIDYATDISLTCLGNATIGTSASPLNNSLFNALEGKCEFNNVHINLELSEDIPPPYYFGGFAVRSQDCLFTDCTMDIKANVEGSNDCGGYVAYSSGLIRLDHCSSTGYIVGGENVGGFFGNLNGYISAVECINRCDVTGQTNVGGLAGYMHIAPSELIDSSGLTAVMDSCSNYGSMTTNVNGGGIVGTISDNQNRLLIQHCANHGEVIRIFDGGIMTEGTFGGVGGIVGDLSVAHIRCDIIDCNNDRPIRGSMLAGGIVGCITLGEGSPDDYITNCVNEAGGTVDGDIGVGGILGGVHPGETTANVAFSGCVNRAAVAGTWYVGGIVGLGQFTVIDACVNSGMITERNIAYEQSIYYNTTNGSAYWTYGASGTIAGAGPEWISTGGIVGILVTGNAVNCVNYGAITSRANFYCTGGIVGVMYAQYSPDINSGVNIITGCLNNGAITGGGYVGGIVGGAYGLQHESKYRLRIQQDVNRGAVVGANEGVGGIAGSVYGNVFVNKCRLCDSAGLIQATGCCAGGIVGLAGVKDSFIGGEYEGLFGLGMNFPSTITISNNAISSETIRVVQGADSVAGQASVHRILGRYDIYKALPNSTELSDDPDAEIISRLMLMRNSANSSTALSGNNSNTQGYYTTEENVTDWGVNYASPNNHVNPLTDPDYGENGQNGVDASCQSGALNDCMYCITLGLCGSAMQDNPDEEDDDEDDGDDGSVGSTAPCGSGLTAAVADVLSGIAAMRISESVYLNAQKDAVEYVVGLGNSGEDMDEINAAALGAMSMLQLIENSLAKEQCCLVNYLQCCCEANKPDCILCLESVDPISGEPIPNALYTLEPISPNDGVIQHVRTGADGVVRFPIAHAGTYRAYMTPRETARDNALYKISVTGACAMTVSVEH